MEHMWRALADHLRTYRFWRDERGNVALLLGLLMIPLMTGMGLVLDGGLLLFEYRGARNAADAAALAGAQKRHTNDDIGIAVGALCIDGVRATRSAVDAACDLAEGYGYASDDIRVYVEDVPHPVLGASKQVEVVISHVYNTLLMRLVGIDQVPLAGMAVAGELSAALGAAIYALDAHACAGFDRTSTGGVYVYGGPIIVDSAASLGCNPAGGALDKTSGGVLCVDSYRTHYDAALLDPKYGCHGEGYISIYGGLDCNGDAECTTIQSTPDLDQGPGGGGFSGDPLSGLPGAWHRPCTGTDNCPDRDGNLSPDDPDTTGHAFMFCDSADDPNGGIDSAILYAPLTSDSRTAGLVSACGSTSVLPTSPLMPRDISGNIVRGRYNVCSAPTGATGQHYMEPGIYWGGVYAGAGCAEGVHFSRGIYIVAGQDSMSETNPKPSIDLNFSSSAGQVTSDDIIFFVTSDPGAIPSAQQTGLILFAYQGVTTMTLKASTLSEADCPQNPNFEGILLFVTRTAQLNPSTAGGSDDNNLVRVHGGNFSSLVLHGVWYDPTGEFQAEGSFQLLDAQIIFNVIDMQNQNDVVIKLPACRARSNQLFLLR